MLGRPSHELARSSRRLRDLVVDGWQHSYPELDDLHGADLLREHGMAFGNIELWSGRQFVALKNSIFPPEPSAAPSTFVAGRGQKAFLRQERAVAVSRRGARKNGPRGRPVDQRTSELRITT